MDFLDDEAEVSSSNDVLVPSSQTDDNPRARKRQRKNRRVSDSDEDEYDLPSPEEAGEEGGDKETRKSKYEERIYVPFAERQPDTFVTQLTQQWSSPSRIRGARWMKPRNNPSPPTPRPLAQATSGNVIRSVTDQPADEFAAEDDDDFALLAAFEAVESAGVVNSNAGNTNRASVNKEPPARRGPMERSTSFRQTTLHGIHTTQQDPPRTQSQTRAHNWPLAKRSEAPTHHEIDREAMGTWVYPTNLGRIRDYQFNIVQKGLFHNLLVALPTGLGKTFIAATIMLNWFRWTKDAQMVFVAPTKPLVSQQIDACFNIAGIPRSQTTMLTGEVSPGIRAEEWQEKRVFFMTPQTLINDLKNGMADPKKIVLVVVDEAHKATGNYAYVEVIKFLRRFNTSFRVLALTATPGATVEAVQEVIDGLGIARTEIRTEESLDIREFVHTRNVETQVFDNSEEITMSLELFSAAVQPLLNKLNSQNAYWGKDPEKITLFGLKKAHDQWKLSEPGRRASHGIKGMVAAIMAVLMSLAHSLELLKYHGIGPFYHKMKLFADGETGNGKYAKQIIEDESFKKLMNRLRIWINDPNFVGHPKLSYLKEVVLNHFMDAGEGRGGTTQPSSTRIMIFAHYRDSAEEISRVLNRHGPMIRAHVFVGQSGTKGSEGMDQKTQLDIIKKFKAGTYNTIVATSIGEEGLDIGEVDLIVCYDCSKSPIRMLQRMGRTGRKRAGNIVLLLMRGKEHDDYYKAKDNYRVMQEKIENGKEFQYHEDLSPRIVPMEIKPNVDKRVVEIPIENSQPGPLEPKRRRAKNPKKPPKKFHMPDGVETGFTFLGGSKKARNGTKANAKTRESNKDKEVALLAPLEKVLLTAAEEEQLDERYVKLAGTEDEYIRHVRFDAFPEQQQRLGKTTAVKHSKATQTIVKAFRAMRDPSQDWERPAEDEEIKDVDVKRVLTAEKAAATRPKKRPAKQPRQPLNPPSSATNDTPGEYDDNDSFIDNGSLPRSDPAGASSDRDISPPEPSPVADKPFWISQESIGVETCEEDLPDITSLFEKSQTANAFPMNISKARALKTSRTRRVVESDDEDE
ncbi:3'-5' DNA helicase [Exophiala xenobiotica]|nr:3'-5' DNA helicase [Exophiala xenobiotica]KAK5211387.1 3'-5' DNA helicase [Exophiala xenobiotica]KAK5218608.1 3'-5' DNA helicase [Exophiala xenobiotica]KAK5221636.1 3'-5' DNA helicase [Exophiala xenobiotica]KAK5252412.1 3'-5' DNA helicase [Exophiala xenobiotica]